MTTIRPQSRVEAAAFTHRSTTLVLTDYLTAYQTQEHLSRAVWPIVLSVKWPQSKGDLRRLLHDDDWLVIREHGPKGVRVHIAFVDSVTRQRRTLRGGETIRSYTVSASHVGKPFAVHEFRFDTGLPKGFPGLLTQDPEIIGKVLAPSEWKPREIMRALFKAVFRPVNVPKPTDKPRDTGAVIEAPKQGKPAVKEGQLTANFHINEFRNPEDDTIPNAEQQANLKQLAEYLQILRDDYLGGSPVRITPIGGFRGPNLNKARGGAARSRHLQGKAADITVAGKTPLEVAQALSSAIAAGALPASYGVFLYKSFVHFDIGVTGDGGEDRPIWAKGKPKDPNLVPDAVSVVAFLAMKPVPGAGVVTTSTDDADGDDEGENGKQSPPQPPAGPVTVVEGKSGDGAFVVPEGLARGARGAQTPTQTTGTGQAPRWDWVDVCDAYTYNDPSERIQGRWWQLSTLYQLTKSTFDSFVRGQCDAQFNELFYDTRRVGKGSGFSELARYLDGWAPVLVYRRRPLDLDDWKRLPTCTINWSDTIGDSLGMGGAERFNFYYAHPTNTPEWGGSFWDEAVKGGGGVVPALALGDFYAHGMRSMTPVSQFIWAKSLYEDTDAAAEPGFTAQIREFSETLYRWHRPLPLLEGGTVDVPWLDADALVGHRLIINGTGADGDPPSHAYIEGVTKTFQIEPGTGARQATTQLMVTRLQPQTQYAAPTPESWR